MTDSRVEDTYAEAFEMKYTRLIVTALNREWLEIAATEFCGYGTSVIGCDAEAGIESRLAASETPDGREGVSILAFGFSTDALGKAVANRTGQCLMTCPTTSVYNGLDANGLDSKKRIPLGKHLRFFGDGFQKSKKLGERRYWRIPVMDGEFICEEELGVANGIGGGNFIVQSRDSLAGLLAAQSAVQAIGQVSGCITPFPGGIARSGSKVGSRYDNQIASTAESYCPTLRGRVQSSLHPDAVCAYEVVIDAVNEEKIRESMRVGIQSALGQSSKDEPGTKAGSDGIVRISAGNYGGKLGKCLVALKTL